MLLRARRFSVFLPPLLIWAGAVWPIPPAPLATPATEAAPPGAAGMRWPVGTREEIDLGRRIYLEGQGAEGKPVLAVRFGGIETEGKDAACVTCHRRSGLGAVEGSDQVPPVAGRFLFSDDPRALVSMNARNLKSFNQRHAPYDEGGFAEVMRIGKHIDGRELGPIMPRYQLNDAELKALGAYLRTLSAQWSPGVSADRIRFATVITPEVEPARRQAFLDTVRAAVAQRNGNVVARGQRTMSAAEMMLRTERRWDLDVWELQGPPETWGRQLDARFKAQPVLALVSGLGDATWKPVHDFCERQRVACWFPSVDLPPADASKDFYSLYFSKGVLLEAEVLAKHVLSRKSKPRRVVQIHAGDDAGRAGAQALQAALAKTKPAIKVEERILPGADTRALQKALSAAGKQDAVMLWLKPGALSQLSDVQVPGALLFASSYMAKGDPVPVPAAWKAKLNLVYPFQLPEKRASGLMYFHAWLNIRKLALSDEVMQSEVYFALTYLAETLMEMLDNVHSDYLIERAENMLSLREGAKAEDEARELMTARHQVVGGVNAALERLKAPEIKRIPRPMPGRKEHAMAKRESTTIYPRLGLGQGQRFASKGAYIVRYSDNAGMPGLTAESDWIVP